ncbi:cupin domain-containing protein [Kyrpidia sp.]|uniref:helix-turn-helix domain-containing protein n=1 Tax=Kyrpidia sp. TaxID=2073077 RepID=UPI0025834167|nr:cupin domain-containing protein [Kyrpidia sp.]MCL6577589.1 cupin domain-containing protein [Kyrpidia sp.]
MGIGKKLRDERKKKGLRLIDLAKKVNMSVSKLSKIETGKDSITVVELMILANALEVPVTAFFLDEVSELIVLTRKEDRRRIIRNLTPKGPVWQEQLTSMRNVKMEPALIYIPPSGESGKEITHEGEEFITVLKGELNIWIANTEYHLSEGDTLYYPATMPHRWINPQESETIILAVSTPPSY